MDNGIIKSRVNALIKNGFFSIFLSNVLAKIVAFMGGTILINVLTKNDYGTFTYVLNAISVLSIFGDFGAANATMQFASENHDNEKKRNAYISLGLRMSLITSLLSCLLIFLSPYFYPFTIDGSSDLTRLLFLTPLIVSLNTFIIGVVRSALQNKKFAFLNCFTAAIHYVFIIPFAYFGGLFGAIISKYFFDGTTLLLGVLLTITLFRLVNYKKFLSKGERKNFLKFSFASQINTTIDTLLISADLFLIGLIIPDVSVIASYKTASIIPNALIFIPSSMIVFFVPYFARNNKNREWMKKNTKLLLCFSIIFYGIICSLTLLLAPHIVTILFGENYLDAIPCFRILTIGFFFSATFKLPLNNILFTMKKVKINIIATTIAGIVNLILDPILILRFGSIGAAMATCLVMIVNSLFVILYTYKLLYRDRVIKY